MMKSTVFVNTKTLGVYTQIPLMDISQYEKFSEKYKLVDSIGCSFEGDLDIDFIEKMILKGSRVVIK